MTRYAYSTVRWSSDGRRLVWDHDLALLDHSYDGGAVADELYVGDLDIYDVSSRASYTIAENVVSFGYRYGDTYSWSPGDSYIGYVEYAGAAGLQARVFDPATWSHGTPGEAGAVPESDYGTGFLPIFWLSGRMLAWNRIGDGVYAGDAAGSGSPQRIGGPMFLRDAVVSDDQTLFASVTVSSVSGGTDGEAGQLILYDVEGGYSVKVLDALPTGGQYGFL